MKKHQVEACEQKVRVRGRKRIRYSARLILVTIAILLVIAIGFWKTTGLYVLAPLLIWCFYRLAILTDERRKQTK